ncbi:MAG: zinc ribbon domain-containing protein [Armatimonadetes bacterium]|nr:zinc ribbon domain-containing protein [Armatimonadota bacterium]
MKTPLERLVCPKCGAAVGADDLTCPSCDAPLETVLIKRATRGRRYVYGKRKAGLSPEVIWLLVVILIGLLIIVITQLFAFMRSRKLVELPGTRPAVARLMPSAAGATCVGNSQDEQSRNMHAARSRLTAGITPLRGTRHEVRLRHLCHAHRPTGRGDPGPRGHRV